MSLSAVSFCATKQNSCEAHHHANVSGLLALTWAAGSHGARRHRTHEVHRLLAGQHRIHKTHAGEVGGEPVVPQPRLQLQAAGQQPRGVPPLHALRQHRVGRRRRQRVRCGAGHQAGRRRQRPLGLVGCGLHALQLGLQPWPGSRDEDPPPSHGCSSFSGLCPASCVLHAGCPRRQDQCEAACL